MAGEFTPDQLKELCDVFETIDTEGDGFIQLGELGAAFKCVGIDLPGYAIRDLVKQYDQNQDGKLSMQEFKSLFRKERERLDFGSKFKTMVQTRAGIKTHGGTSQASSEGTTHSVRDGEATAFSNWINRNLAEDADCKKYLPIDSAEDLYKSCFDGIILCKLINQSVPDTVSEEAINKTNLSVYRRSENITLALNSAASIGCNIVNIDAVDIQEGKPHLILGVLWQIIRIGLLSDINLAHNPGLVALLLDGEEISDLQKLSPEQILLRWVNYHLDRAGANRNIKNFSEDIKDSEAYSHLLNQIAPRDANVTLAPLNTPAGRERAEAMLCEADKIGCRSFVGAKDVTDGNAKLNLAFVANLFNNYPALDKVDNLEEFEAIEETREEKTYRNWMNSMGVNPHVHHLYTDLRDCLVIFKILDIIQPGVVNWNKVVQKFSKMKVNFEKLENCNYAVELGIKQKFSLIGIGGQDMHEGNPTLTLAYVWQLMKAYTLSILSKLKDSNTNGNSIIAEQQIIDWANKKMGDRAKFSNFKDPSLSDGITVLTLIDCLRPGTVKWEVVKKTDLTEETRMANAKYAVSMARKIGARVYALPEDIVEVKPKMIMTIFACLMSQDPDFKGRGMTSGMEG
ncbi:hypothetical protein SNE40_003233 [Patella caerulea]|uniref:Fimbrin n=1 Tax=Patella caerulea TaxID=87958 RepID=A0AAN8Q8D7_PATCE